MRDKMKDLTGRAVGTIQDDTNISVRASILTYWIKHIEGGTADKYGLDESRLDQYKAELAEIGEV